MSSNPIKAISLCHLDCQYPPWHCFAVFCILLHEAHHAMKHTSNIHLHLSKTLVGGKRLTWHSNHVCHHFTMVISTLLDIMLTLLVLYFQVTSCKVGHNKKEGDNFAMIAMTTKEDAIRAIKKMDRLAFNGRILMAKRVRIMDV